MVGGWFRDWAITCVKDQKRDRDEFWWSPGPPGRQYNIHYFNPKVLLKTFQGPNGRLQVLLSQQPSYIRFQYLEACCGACPTDSSGQHGAPPLSMGEDETTHSGLQHVATGKVLKIKSQVWNTLSIISSLVIAPAMCSFCGGDRIQKHTAPWLHVALAQHLNGVEPYAWEIDQPHGLPQTSIYGCALQLLLPAACPTLDSCVVQLPWREECFLGRCSYIPTKSYTWEKQVLPEMKLASSVIRTSKQLWPAILSVPPAWVPFAP